jgi:hypothetical protein
MRKQYGWGVRGWGASQNNPMSALIKSASLYLSADKADGQPFVKLEPRTLPNGVSNGEYTPQNVSGDVVITRDMFSSVNDRGGFVHANLSFSLLPFIPTGAIQGIQGTFAIDNFVEVAARFSGGYNGRQFSTETSSGGRLMFELPPSTTLEQAKDILAGTVIRYQLAVPIDTLNVPFKNPWKDLKGDADCTLVNFAGTTADGYTVQTINGKTNTFLNLDGLNSFGQFANMDVLNPVGTDDFCQMVVFRPDDVNASRFYGLSRMTNTGATSQYRLLHSSDGNTYCTIDGTTRVVSASNTNLKYILSARINNRWFLILNGVEIFDVPLPNLITTRPNTQLCCASNTIDGLSKGDFGKGLQGDIAFWKGAQGTLDKDKIVDLVRKAMKSKYGLGV